MRLRVRENATGGKRTVSLPTNTFIGRFLRHVLPAGFKRLSHCGLLACGHKRARLAAARGALRTPAPHEIAIEAAEHFLVRVAGEDPRCCPHCRGALAHGRDCYGSSVRSARTGAALSGWAPMNAHARPS